MIAYDMAVAKMNNAFGVVGYVRLVRHKDNGQIFFFL